MKTAFRAFLCGVAFMLGVAGVGASIIGIHAATVSLLTGPAGTNPAQNPTVLGDLNSVIQSVNANAAFAGSGTPSLAIGVNSVTTSTILSGSNTFNMLQIIPQVFTTTTNTGVTCRITGATQCLGIQDNNGTLRWIGVN